MNFPMNGDLLNLIDHTVKRCVSEAVIELKRQNLIAEGKQTPFQKTETLLFNYNNFVAAVKDKEDQIEELKEYGLKKKSNSISSYMGNSGLIEVKSEQEKVEDRIEAIELSMQVTKNFINIIDGAVDSLKNDSYYDLIRMRYFEGYSREDIAEHFNFDVRTVNRHKNRLVNLLQIRLFSDEVIERIFLS